MMLARSAFCLRPGSLLVTSSQGLRFRRISNGLTLRAVIGLDLNYRGKESTVSMWRPKFFQEDGEEFETMEVMQEIGYQPFRSAEGSPADPDACLTLRLRDFATDELPLSHEHAALSISYGQLHDDLTRAEEMQSVRDPNKGAKSSRKRKKRKPSSSPRDIIRSDDEAAYALQEQQADERAAAEDTDFSAPAPKRRASKRTEVCALDDSISHTSIALP
ncbi:hypothetical protein B0T10DRAFT_569115 [Thelonectria olida]|uniref:Uncharacterized protein n=1 Tax=Thelonectria olida TaxID=1576542 RepID=A0A9P9AI01_9HYPO|nr:hypothetical protein B0T10DRAFT_569115 [Thelonectria olida]